MNFPPAFFDIMVHLPIHLCNEIELGGPVHQRWMYSIERYLGKLKRYVRNKSKPEGSIAEGYLADECLIFCSRFLGDDSVSNAIRNVEASGYPIGLGKNKDGKAFNLCEDTWISAHRYVLFNYDDKEVEKLIEKHRALFDENTKSKRYKRERDHTGEVCEWFKNEIASLAKGPNRAAKRFSGYIVNGYRFHTKLRDQNCTTQNSGVYLTALTTSFASSKDQNPKTGDVNYYDDKDSLGFTRVNFNRVRQKDDPFVMSTQVQQVFYIQDPTELQFYYPIKKFSSESFEQDDKNLVEDDINGKFTHDSDFHSLLEEQDTGVSWFRDDVPSKQIPIPVIPILDDCTLAVVSKYEI
ncbi:hypothetical protein DCAR_0729384 [Daucus carota subsp. sativus]|uniref:DUF4218 domain-containing protein n=1 Tax=Daucus carota subsp. sativus TaxID=79200 RepID=A0AAF0XNB4_DAUCS|nr:hypothetical protein DCAR_0729384 [Daucus carota subsp. sativus]